MATVRVLAGGTWTELPLLMSREGQPMFAMSVLNPIRQTVFTGEASYAAFDVQKGGVFAQPDFSRGAGKRLQAPADSAEYKRYHYTENADASVPGQVGPGPKVNSIAKVADAGSLTGAFELGGTLYLICGRKIVSVNMTTHAITEVEDLGVGVAGYGGATFFQLGSATSDQASTSTGNTYAVYGSRRVAQKITPGASGYLSKVVLSLQATGTPSGDVEISVQADDAGQPSGVDIATTTIEGSSVAAGSYADYTFNFNPRDYYLQVSGEPFWLVMAVPSGTASNYVTPDYNIAASTYAGGFAGQSTDGGSTWTMWANNADLDFTTYYKAITSTAFVGKVQGAKFLTTTDGSAYTADSTYEGLYWTVHEDCLVRDARASSAGAICWSYDGVSWDLVVVGDPTVTIRGLYSMPGALIVCKQDSIWAIDLSEDTPEPKLLYAGGSSASNGGGGCYWQTAGAVFVPFDGRLVAIKGNFTDGFTVHQNIGPESLDEWDSPWGTGRAVALAGDRYNLYAAVSTSTSYKLFKSSDPLADPPEWHGSIADLGTPTTFTRMYVFDRGAATSPELFFSTDSDNVGYIILPRTAVPWADSAYQVTTSAAKLYHQTATGLMYVTPKAWLAESVTFFKEVGGGYVETLYDTDDGLGWRILDKQLYKTGVMRYPRGTTSLLLKRQTRLYAPSATSYPLLLASGLTYGVRPAEPLRQFNVTFTVEARDGLSATQLGRMLGVSGKTMAERVAEMASGGGTVLMEDPWQDEHEVLFSDCQDVMVETSESGGRKVAAVQVSGVTV